MMRTQPTRQAGPEPEADLAPAANLASPRGARVLVADDDYEMRALLVRALRKASYEVIECPDGWRLLGYVTPYLLSLKTDESLCFDLVITDVRMPVLSGLQILEGSQGIDGFPPVILMTAFGDQETRALAERAGAAAWFEKPFDIDSLVADVRRIVPPNRTEVHDAR
jgi:DNA-binding response OmpR family regulator